MLRVVVHYQNGESLFFDTSQFDTVDDLEQRFSGPLPWIFQTSKGAATIDREDVLEVYVQRLLHGRYKTIGRLELNQIMTLGQAWVNTREDKDMDEEKTNIQEPVAEPPNAENPAPSASTGTLVPYQQGEVSRFVSFRDTIVKSRENCDGWMQRIVEKQLEHEQLLTDACNILEQRNVEARDFKKNIVGK